VTVAVDWPSVAHYDMSHGPYQHFEHSVFIIGCDVEIWPVSVFATLRLTFFMFSTFEHQLMYIVIGYNCSFHV